MGNEPQMTKTIRPGRSAYLPLGVIVIGLVALWVFVWIYRGPQTKAWQPIVLIIGFYILWCLVLLQRVIIVDDHGICCTYLIKKTCRVTWSEIRHSEVTYWIDRKPFQIIVFGDSSNKPLLDIPIKLYDQPEAGFLLGLDGLKIRITPPPPINPKH